MELTTKLSVPIFPLPMLPLPPIDAASDTLLRRITVFHACGNDSPVHAMTQYVLRISEALRAIGVASYVLTDMPRCQVPARYAEMTIPDIDWITLHAETIRSLAGATLPILHLHMSHPHHGTLVSQRLVAELPTVITCHEHRTKSDNDQHIQRDYCRLAERVMVSSAAEADALEEDAEVRRRLISKSVGAPRLVFPVPPNITPTADALVQIRDGIAWFGMFRNGHDWDLLAEVVKVVRRRLPGTKLHLIGAAMNPRSLLTVLDKIFGKSFASLTAAASQKVPEVDRMVLGKLKRFVATGSHAHLRGGDVYLHLDLEATEVSKLLMASRCAFVLRPPDEWDHSGSLAALLAHGVPTIAAYVSDTGEHCQPQKWIGVVDGLAGATVQETANKIVCRLESLLSTQEEWLSFQRRGLKHACDSNQDALAQGCCMVYREVASSRYEFLKYAHHDVSSVPFPNLIAARSAVFII